MSSSSSSASSSSASSAAAASPAAPAWGAWMGGWKAGARDAGDGEAARLDRQKAAFGADTLARLKDLNVLVLGCRGAGVETCKNLILSNVGAVVCWDPSPTEPRDRGSNFYLTAEHAARGTPRAPACAAELKSLNPYCKVECLGRGVAVDDALLLDPDVNGTGRPFAAVVVTVLLPRDDLFRINRTARAHGIAFVLALTSGVTASLFSDFGDNTHLVTDPDGEPLDPKAITNIEVLKKTAALNIRGVADGDTVIVVTTDSPHGLDDDAVVALDDLGQGLSGSRFRVRRFSVKIFDPERQCNPTNDPQLTRDSVASLQSVLPRMLDTARGDWAQAGRDPAKFNGKCRTITMLNRLVLIAPASAGDDDAAASSAAPPVAEYRTPPGADLFSRYTFGGLVNPLKPAVRVQHASLEDTLLRTRSHGMSLGPEMEKRFPQMLSSGGGEAGHGVECHLQWQAALEFQAANGRWPRVHSGADADAVFATAQALSAAAQAKDADGGAPTIWAQTYTAPDYVETFDAKWGVPRELDAVRVKRFSRFFSCELTGLCAFVGGAAAQEVIKKTGKFTPIDQWIHHEDHALVTDESPSNTGPAVGSRYDDQISVLGKDFQRRAANARVFLVGCGALGCEYLKGMALMGVGTGQRGKVSVTDMDIIETSNLSRQFLFRSTDVGSSKSLSGARVVQGWNNDMHVDGIEK